MTKTVYVAYSRRAEVYHTRETCDRLPDDEAKYRETTRAAMEPHYDECAICEDASTRSGGGANTTYYATVAEGREE